jgi:cytochrome P450
LLASHVSAAAADPYDSLLRSRARGVKAELDRAFQTQPAPLRSSTFVALSHTVACLLANSWVALAEWPDEYTKLRAHDDLLPKATEEFIRYAGIPRSLSRRAAADIEIGGVTIAQGEQVVLMVASANRDPAQFSDPNRLDVTRPAAGQLGFGAGPHSCVGSTLIRMALTVATGTLIATFPSMELAGPPAWRGGEGFRTPEALTVVLKRDDV